MKGEIKLYPKLIGKRNELSITQEKMAELLGISKNNYNLKENGKLDFNLVEVKKILEILNETYENIFSDQNVTQKSYNEEFTEENEGET